MNTIKVEAFRTHMARLSAMAGIVVRVRMAARVIHTFVASCGYAQIARILFGSTVILLVGCAGGGDGTDTRRASNDNEQANVAALTAETIQVSDSELFESDTGLGAIVSMGTVRTVEIEETIFTSLPEASVDSTLPSVQLGRLLFWDPVLSGDQDIACGTCHLPEFGYADGRALALGTSAVGTGPDRVPGQTGEGFRNAQSVLNTVWNGINELGVSDPQTAAMFWDGRTQSLPAQALEPIRNVDEMRGRNVTEAEIIPTVLARLSSNSQYQALFADAFDDSAVSAENLAQALADFQSTLIANNAPFDRWMRGEQGAMSDAQLQGLVVFAQTGCAECHSGAMFSDFDTHVLGVPEADGLDEPDSGNGSFGFRTPTLRQLAFTAPYFHGGQESDLADVIDFYDNPDRSENPNVATNQLDDDFRRLPNLNGNESNAIEAFLGSLSDPDFDQTRPESVPSGLPVGGAL